MDYRVLAAEELKRMKNQYVSEKAIRMRIMELETLLKSCGGGTGGGSPTGNGGNKTEQRWISLISSIDREKERLENLSRDIRRIEYALETVEEDEARILKMSYIEHRNMEEIAQKEHISRATAFRKRDKALVSFTRALYGVVKK
jgi:RinA family phage transcriptional activator